MDFYLNVPPPVYYLDAEEAFRSLNNKEREYIFASSQSSWIGSLICLLQTSPESAGIFLFINQFFASQNLNDIIQKAQKCGFSNDEIDEILAYFACVLGNMGNYHSFGDTKFIPSVECKRLFEFLSMNSHFKDDINGIKSLWEEVSPSVYSLESRRLRLGFGPTELTSYYSENCVREDAELVQKYLESKRIEAYNTRIFKSVVNDKTIYTLRVASSSVFDSNSENLSPNISICTKYGDFSHIMAILTESSLDAHKKALNPVESQMWQLYAKSFESGSIEVHKEASKLWVQDKNPVVESYIGFIETYRDPFGVRAEFEGFVAVVNKSMSVKFQRLVDNAVDIISQLPWPSDYEKDTFLQPDFTSLDVITFATSGIPVGINIPNYDDVRQVNGFKNVSLGNVLSSRFKDPKTEYICEEDKKSYLENVANSFELQVGLHELLGHGSGKLFCQYGDGTFNFDKENVKDITTGRPVNSWYKSGETWDSKFASFSSSMEECRAECVGIYLCSLKNILKLFDFDCTCQDDQDVPNVTYINWLSMIKSGVTSMEFYSPPENTNNLGSWRQAHCCARYVILRVLIEADDRLIHIDKFIGEDNKPNFNIIIDRKKILAVARPAIGQFLTKLQCYKSTGNAKEGCAYFEQLSQLLPEHLELRKIVIDRKKPRPIFVQPGMRRSATANEINLISYPITYGGVIQSFLDRFNDFPLGQKALNALGQAWRADKPYFKEMPV